MLPPYQQKHALDTIPSYCPIIAKATFADARFVFVLRTLTLLLYRWSLQPVDEARKRGLFCNIPFPFVERERNMRPRPGVFCLLALMG